LAYWKWHTADSIFILGSVSGKLLNVDLWSWIFPDFSLRKGGFGWIYIHH